MSFVPKRLLLDAVDVQGRPGDHRGVDIAEVPLVGRDLAVRVEVAFVQDQLQLLLGEGRIDHRERDRVEREVPGRVPGVLPLVRHRDDVRVVHVEPLVVADGLLVAQGDIGPVLAEPAVQVVEVVLLRPEHAGQGLPHHVRRVRAERRRGDVGVAQIRFADPRLQYLLEPVPEGFASGSRRGRRGVSFRRSRTTRLSPPGMVIGKPGRGLRPGTGGVHRRSPAGDDAVVDAVLHVGGGVRGAGDALLVGLVLGEEQVGGALAVEIPHAEGRMGGLDHAGAGGTVHLFQERPPDALLEPPGVAEPERRQQVQDGLLRPPVPDRDPDQDVLGGVLRVLHEDVEVAIVVEDPGVDEFVLRFVPGAFFIGLYKVVVRKCRLRILVQVFHVGVRRGIVQVIVVLLHVLAVVPLVVHEAEQSLLEERIRAVPECQGKAESAENRPRCLQSRPPPTGRRGSVPGRGGNTPRSCRPRCNLPAPCPIAVRSGRGPICARGRSARGPREAAVPPVRGVGSPGMPCSEYRKVGGNTFRHHEDTRGLRPPHIHIEGLDGRDESTAGRSARNVDEEWRCSPDRRRLQRIHVSPGPPVQTRCGISRAGPGRRGPGSPSDPALPHPERQEDRRDPAENRKDGDQQDEQRRRDQGVGEDREARR